MLRLPRKTPTTISREKSTAGAAVANAMIFHRAAHSAAERTTTWRGISMALIAPFSSVRTGGGDCSSPASTTSSIVTLIEPPPPAE